jgi:hypothetical protein
MQPPATQEPHAPASPGWTRCTAKSKRSQQQCRGPAVKGTDKCRMHGGTTPIQTGLHSKYARGRLATRIDELRSDPRLLDIDTDIAALRALQEEVLERLDRFFEIADAPAPGDGQGPQKIPPLPLDAVDALRQLHGEVGRLIERRKKLQTGEGRTVPLDFVLALLDKFTELVNRFVTDDATKRALVDGLVALGDLKVPAKAAQH